MPGKFAILMDGGFVKRKIIQRTRSFPTIDDFRNDVTRIRKYSSLAGSDLLGIYTDDAPPASGILHNPVDKTRVTLEAHPVHLSNTKLHQQLEIEPDFALRMGDTDVHGWTIGGAALRRISRNPRPVTAKDRVPHIEQKGG